MHGRISLRLARMLAVFIILGGSAALRGQESSQSPATASPGQQIQAPASYYLASDAPATTTATVPDYSLLPPADNSNLSQRVSDLEKQLAEYSKAAAAGSTSAAPTKPLVAPTGRIQMDAANFSQDPTSIAQVGNAANAVGFRRARLALVGEYGIVDYIIEMDFANRGANSLINSKDQSTAFKDVYVQIRDLPLLGVIRVGHFKECFGLEQLTSDNYTTFMERSVNDEGTFVPGRNDGIMAYNWSENQRATWAAGVFTNQTGFDQPPTFQYDHWGLDFAARATYLPWYDEASEGRGLIHTGIDYAYRTTPDAVGQTFAIRPECNFAPAIINLTLLDVNRWQEMDAEGALVYGPLSFQTEVFGASIVRQTGGNTNFYGTYAYVSYFLTGENRPYNRKLGVFDRVRPYEDFFRVRTCDGCTETGHGAWEIAYRFSYIDMLDNLGDKGAGRAADHTIGLNWYLNPFTRIMFNYVHSIDTYNTATNTRISGGNIDVFETRLAIDF